MKRFHHLVAAATCAFATAMAPAAVQIVNSAGKLTGATGVTVNSKTYNVTFVEGTCAGVYGRCETANFDFSTRSDAIAAMAALGSQVLQDTALGKFASDPALTFGCSSDAVCESVLVYSPAIGVSNGAAFQNYNPAIFGDVYGSKVVDLTQDTGKADSLNYVRFALVQAASPAPEPASWAMMIGGFGMIGAVLRRRKLARRIRFA